MENSPCPPCDLRRARWLSVSPGQMDSANLSWTMETASCCHTCVELRGTSSQSSSRRGRTPLATSTHVGAKNPIPINWSRLELALLMWIPPVSNAWSNSPAMTGWRALPNWPNMLLTWRGRHWPGRCSMFLGAPSA